jgi:hypothetical protein
MNHELSDHIGNVDKVRFIKCRRKPWLMRMDKKEYLNDY